jgi:hypothetical protein
MEKANGGSFARTTRKTAEDEGRRRGGFGQALKHANPGQSFLAPLGRRHLPQNRRTPKRSGCRRRSRRRMTFCFVDENRHSGLTL